MRPWQPGFCSTKWPGSGRGAVEVSARSPTRAWLQFTFANCSEAGVEIGCRVAHAQIVAVHLRNPHSILATFARRPEAVIDVRLPAGPASDAWRDVERLAREYRVPVVRGATHGERVGRRGQREAEGGRGGIAEATVKEHPEVPLEVLFGVDPQESGQADSAGTTAPTTTADGARALGSGWPSINCKTRTTSEPFFGRPPSLVSPASC